MSKKAFKSQASSSRAVSGAFRGLSKGATFDSSFGSSAFGAVPSSPLSYVYEPPDLGGLSEPNVGVAFKNVQKKDGTTKAKALEDLQGYIASLEADKSGVENAILEAWIKIYPRTSIDTSRRVRQLAHIFQGQIALSCGKRIAKHLPTIISSWLAGLYDNDKSVSRAANESFHLVFPSIEKKGNVWRLYQTPILEYSRDVIVKETAATLSDERSVSPDDASAKYSRVIGAAVLMVTNLMESTSQADSVKNQGLVDELLNEDKLWKLATHDDPFVRRALYRLLNVALARQKKSLSPNMISANILTSGLHASQAGSALDFVKAISTLSAELPDVWTLHYTGSGKKSAQNRLQYFLGKGSQGGPPEFWSYMSMVISNLPLSILTSGNGDEHAGEIDGEPQPFSTILGALHEGLNNKDEGRQNQGIAWNVYLNAFELVEKSLPQTVNRRRFYEENIFPILRQYIKPSSELSRWAVSGPQQHNICVRVCNLVLLESQELFEEEWQALSTKIIEGLKTSLPEQSKEYIRSQDSIAADTKRWYKLQSSLLGSTAGNSLDSLIEHTLSSEIQAIMTVLKNRNGKPYGAAAALESLIQLSPRTVWGVRSIKQSLLEFANNAVPNLVLSPSSKYLIEVLKLFENEDDVSQAYGESMRKLVNAPESEAKSNALQTLLSSSRLSHDETLTALVLSSLRHALEHDDERSWKLVIAAIANSAAPSDLTDDLLAHMMKSLSVHTENIAGLHGLEMVERQGESMIKDFVLSTQGSSLLSALLSLSESSDETVAERARSLSRLLERKIASDGSSDQVTRSILDMIKNNIVAVGPDSFSVEILVTQAQKLFEQTASNDKSDIAAELVPNVAQWNLAMGSIFNQSPNPSLAITNSLGGAVSLISIVAPASAQPPFPKDGDGYSSAIRVARFTTKLISSTSVFEQLSEQQKALTCKQLALFVQLAGDSLSISEATFLWDSSNQDLMSRIVDLVAETQSLLALWLQLEPSEAGFISIAQRQLLSDSNGLAVTSYYSARAYSAMSTEVIELHGHARYENDTDRLKAMRKSANIFADAAYLTSAPDSKELHRLCNELLADLTGHDFDKDKEAGIRKFVLLNSIFHGADDYAKDIPQQRLVFLIKHTIQQLQIMQPTSVPGAQVMTVLAVVLPAVSQIYGEFWADILDVICEAGLQYASDDSLCGIHASLRLLQLLKKPQMLEANDDLLDAWTEKKKAIAGALLNLLTQVADISDESHQPRRIVNELLSRQLSALSQDVEVDSQVLYPVLNSGSTALQEIGYELLHNYIPSVQEHVSVDKALSKDYVPQLPQELLSLILTTPSMEYLAEADFERAMPSSLRSYLLSWKLTFDHWQNASYKVQADYVAALQEGTYVQDFLNFALNILITARTKPIDASKFDIEAYTPKTEESPEKETHWLLIHLYYLCLRHLPSPTKAWWRDTASRQLNIALESWTEKHISPLIIASELSTINDWAPSQATADQPMTIKVSLSAREITASIPIDEQTMAIAIHLPKSYPLARAEVTSVHRVGVAEKKWNSWLIITQGVINFSSGGAGEGNALIDGLMAWRKNVTAAMKGQTECAICYSVVSADRQLPSKKCQTCKNTFHSSCLFRWFKSSNSSSCPLCRNAFNYS